MSRLNLPNRITLMRVLLVPLYLLLMSALDLACNWPAALVFAAAAASDWVDGHIARKRQLITDFGKFIDPIADKLLVLLPMIFLAARGGRVDLWVALITVAREVVISGFRLVAAGRGSIIAAGWTGKIKTTVQMLAILLITLGVLEIGWWMAWISAALAVYSGAVILIRNRAVLRGIA